MSRLMQWCRRGQRCGRGALLLSIAADIARVTIVVGLTIGFGPARHVSATPQPELLDAGEDRHVLLLNSYHDGLSWTDSIVTAVRSVILDPEQNPWAASTELYVEYMDTKRFPMTEAVEAHWREYLAAKYAAVPLDVIVVSDNDAYHLLRRAGNELFPDTPVVFCGINFFRDEDLELEDANGLSLSERFTGVVERVDFLSTIQLALRLHQEVRRIIVVNDVTTTGELVQQELLAVLGFFPATTFEMLLNPTSADLDRLRTLPNDTLVLLVLLNRDGEGRFYTYEQSIEMLLTLTDRPIYGVWDFYLGNGLVGGMLTNGTLQGETAALMTTQLLSGASVRDVPIVHESPNRFMFDYDHLRRFGIPLRSIPAGGQTATTVVLGRPTPSLPAYGSATGVGVVLLVLASGALLLQRNHLRKQRAAAGALRSANAALEETRASMETQVAERTEELARRSRQFQIASAVAREVASGALGGQAGTAGVPVEGVGSLLERVATLISESFGFYHVAVFLIDEVGEYAVLRAASSPGGRAMAARGHRLRVGGQGRGTGQGIVGHVAGEGRSRIALEVGRDELWRGTAELSATQSEIALPLQIQGFGGDEARNWIIGVLDVQSQERGAFRQDDVEVLEIVADQLALAIQISRLFEESRRAVERLEEGYAERVRAPWYRARVARAYGFDGVAVQGLGESVSMDAGVGDVVSEGDGTRERLGVPISLRGEVVGTIMLERDVADRPWLPEERALARAIGAQAGLSLEGAQLLSDSKLQAQRQQVLGDIASRMRETLDVDMILQTALREMGDRLGISGIEVRMRGGSND
jgi:GAF domain-containing protein